MANYFSDVGEPKGDLASEARRAKKKARREKKNRESKAGNQGNQPIQSRPISKKKPDAISASYPYRNTTDG